ncbi:MAG: hypothetical protein ACM3TR_06515, partial [Caulobacteraceae bacterium]
YYKLTPVQFFASIIFFAVSGLIWLYILNRRNQSIDLAIDLEDVKIRSKMETSIWIVLFVIIVLSVFNIISYITALILTLGVTFTVNRKLVYEIDYLLLMTFICFFIFIGNVSAIPAITNYMKASLSSSISTYFSSIILSQFISNVPCSIFLSRFTSNWRELLLGVNIGGMGTLIASLASVISFKLFTRENPGSSRKYILKFTAYNVISLLIFTVINYFVVIYG